MVASDGVQQEIAYLQANGCFVKLSHKIISSRAFLLGIDACILLNTLVLAANSSYYVTNGIPYVEGILEITNYLFCVIFLVELILKMVGRGPKVSRFANEFNFHNT